MKEDKSVVAEKQYHAKNDKYPDAKWYVVQTQSNTEKKATVNLLEAIKLKGFEEKIIEVFYPVVETIEMKSGKKRKVITKPFAGYIFVFAVMDDEVFTIIKNTHRIVGFPSKNPTRPLPLHMSTKEIESVINAVRIYKDAADNKFNFSVGDMVRVSNPELAFYDMIGKVLSYNAERGKAKVEMSVFGRGTEIEVPLDSIVLCNKE